jgi:hypothetical protein
MTRICLLGVLLGATLTCEASAQFIAPVIGIPAIAQSGIDFHLGGKHLRIDGFIPTGIPYGVIVPVTPTPFGFKQVAPAFLPFYYGNPYYTPLYGAIDQRVTVQVITPTVLVRPRRPSYDLSGIDLDVETPDKLWGSKSAVAKEGAPKKGELVKAPVPPPKEIAKVAPPEEKKAPVIAANPAKPPPAPPPPKLAMVPQGQRLVGLGTAAFKDGDYNIAILRFRQAALSDPPAPRAVFLQAQAAIAIGKYHDAAELIQQELARQPNWPTSAFRPKADLYGNPEAWNVQRERLLAAQKLQPKNADFPFLLGYLSWFDGERDVALDHFQQSRTLMPDPRWSDVFLKGAAAKAK